MRGRCEEGECCNLRQRERIYSPPRRRRAAAPFQWINNFGPRYWGTHLWASVYTSVWWERQSSCFSRRRHWAAKGFCICPPMEATEAAEEDEMDSAHFQFAVSKETLKKFISSKDSGTESCKWFSMFKSHQFCSWIAWKYSRYSRANEKGISVNHARWIPSFSRSLFLFSCQLFRKTGIFFSHSVLCLYINISSFRLRPSVEYHWYGYLVSFYSCSLYLQYKYRQPNIDRIHQRLLSVDCVRRASSPTRVEGVLESENLASRSAKDVIQYIHDERWKPTLFSSVYIIVL